MMFVGFLGCYGAIQESQCLLGTFFTCLVILFACEVAAGIWGFVNKDQVSLGSPSGRYALCPPTDVGCSEPIVIGCFLNFLDLLLGWGQGLGSSVEEVASG